jgi:acetolactate synthase-1/2/3 large subunit
VTVSRDSASHWVAHAAQLALAEPRGPVHLDVPADVTGQEALPVAANPVPAPPARPADSALDQAAALIRGARRPVVLAGLGCRLADTKWLRAFCEALPAPLLATYKAKGALPDPHPLAMGVFTGGALEEPFVRQADLIIAFGLDLVELIPRAWPYQTPVLNLTRCPANAAALAAPGGGAYFRPAAEVVGDLGAILEELAPRLASAAAADWDVAAVDRCGVSAAPRWRCPCRGWRRIAWRSSRASSCPPAPSPPWTRAPTCSPSPRTGTPSSPASASSPTASRPWGSRSPRRSPRSSTIPTAAWCASPGTGAS